MDTGEQDNPNRRSPNKPHRYLSPKLNRRGQIEPRHRTPPRTMPGTGETGTGPRVQAPIPTKSRRHAGRRSLDDILMHIPESAVEFAQVQGTSSYESIVDAGENCFEFVLLGYL